MYFTCYTLFCCSDIKYTYYYTMFQYEVYKLTYYCNIYYYESILIAGTEVLTLGLFISNHFEVSGCLLCLCPQLKQVHYTHVAQYYNKQLPM